MATVFRAPDEFPPPTITIDDLRSGEYQRKEADYIQQLADRAKMNGSNPLHGEVISFPVADGAAQYLVWKTSPLQLIHLELGDAWHADKILLRGLRLADVRERVEGDRRLRALFDSKRKDS